MELTQASIILADISGYTGFVQMHRVSLLHAEQIITELMEAIIREIEEPLILNKLEGDAALLYARTGEDGNLARNLLDQMMLFFAAFKARQQELIKSGEGGCFCEACCNIDQLRLKIIAHYGQVVIKQVRHLEELAGSDVILAHRLLKNKIPTKEYLFLTEMFYQWSGNPPGLDPQDYEDAYEDLGVVRGRVYYPPMPLLEIPKTPRFTKLSGILAGIKLFPKYLRQRLFRPRTYRNLPS